MSGFLPAMTTKLLNYLRELFRKKRPTSADSFSFDISQQMVLGEAIAKQFGTRVVLVSNPPYQVTIGGESINLSGHYVRDSLTMQRAAAVLGRMLCIKQVVFLGAVRPEKSTLSNCIHLATTDDLAIVDEVVKMLPNPGVIDKRQVLC